jgi:thymidylate synthase (FAD)
MDPLFRVEVISQTPNPQQTIYAAMHQDYAEGFVSDERDRWPSEEKAGEIAVNNLLKGGRGHYGPLEHPQIVFNAGWFPHSTMQQMRTHRVGVSFDVQSFRYTGQRLYKAGHSIAAACKNPNATEGEIIHVLEDPTIANLIESVIYLRPVGEYADRQGGKYEYDQDWRRGDMAWAAGSLLKYFEDTSLGKSEEHARGLIPFDVRQHWVMSANVRSLMHLLDLRWKADAQLEAQKMCEAIWPHFQAWVPSIADWYEKTRAKKARLAP